MSLINDALKRASESQAQAATRPRGPKGVEDLPVPMTPVAARERPAWLPVAAVGLLIVALLGASGFFFAKWWKERKAWQPYAETPEDEPATNVVAKAKAPPDTKQAKAIVKTPPVIPPSATNPPAKTNVAAAVVPPVKAAITNPPPPTATNPVVAVKLPPKQPDPVVPIPPVNPPPPSTPTNPPPATKAETNAVVIVPPVQPPPRVTPDTSKKGDVHSKVPAAEFPEIKLQGIIRAKKKVSAVVNGKTLSLGDRIEGAFLLKIDQESVTFEKGSVKREFFLLR